MSISIEDRIDSLTQTLEAVVGALNTRGDSQSSPAPTVESIHRAPVLVTRFTENLADYDFSDVPQLSGGEVKVVKIIQLMGKGLYAGDNNARAMMRVELSNGRTPLIKPKWIGSGSRATGVAQKPRTAATLTVAADIDGDLTTVAAAAVNLERLAARTPALQSFYAFTHSKGAAYCFGVLKPLLATSPFPAAATAGQKVAHLRSLLAKHIAPGVETIAPGTQEQRVEQNAEQFPAGSAEAWRADANARREFCGSFSAYQAFCRRFGKPAL